MNLMDDLPSIEGELPHSKTFPAKLSLEYFVRLQDIITTKEREKYKNFISLNIFKNWF
jgi:hypothetical protein